MDEAIANVKELFDAAALDARGRKTALRALVAALWPDLPPWSTLDAPKIEEVQKASVGCGILMTFVEDGVRKVVLAQAGAHYDGRGKAAGALAFMIPGGFINLSHTTGSRRVPASDKPEDPRIGAAREGEEELKTDTGAPLLEIDPARLRPMDTAAMKFPNGDSMVVVGVALDLDAAEVAVIKNHVARLAADAAYRSRVQAHTINPASRLPEVETVTILPLGVVAGGGVPLLHADQLGLFCAAQMHYGTSLPQSRPATP